MSAEYPVGTVARVRVGEWEGQAGRDAGFNGDPYWALLGHPEIPTADDHDVTVLAVELSAPVAEPKAFGARVEFGPEGEREEAVLADPSDRMNLWFVRHGILRGFRGWSDLTNPVVLHDPEADR